MTARPVTVTIISWINIGLSAVGGLSMLFTVVLLSSPAGHDALAKNHMPPPVQLGMLFAALVIVIGCAIGFLLRQNWARYVFVVWSVGYFVYDFGVSATSDWLLIPNLVLFVITLVIIFRPDANRYFSHKGDDTPSPPSIN